MTYTEMMQISKDFYDKIDFQHFLGTEQTIDVHALMKSLDRYYTDLHPELLPMEFEGEFFNFVTDYEFAEYLSDRYNFSIEEQMIINLYLLRRHDEDNKTF